MTSSAPRPWPPGGGAMAARVRAHDWAATPLGDSAGWPAELKSAVAFVLDSSFPAMFVAQQGLVAIPNDACLPLMGDLADAVGRSVAEFWPALGDRVARALADEALVTAPVEEGHGPGDARSDLTFGPVRDAQGEVIGCIGLAATDPRGNAAPRASEEAYRSVFATIDEGFCIVEILLDASGRPADYSYLEVNPAFEQHIGLAGVAGKRGSEVTPEDGRGRLDTYAGVALQGESTRFEEHYVATDRWYDIHASRCGQPEQRQVCIVSTDITARRQAEQALRADSERQAFLLNLNDALRAEPSAERLLTTGCRLLGEQLGAARIVFAEIDEQAGVAHIREGWVRHGAQGHPATLRLSDFGGPLLDELRAGRTVHYDDVGRPPFARPDLAVLDAIGVRAVLSVPMMVAGRFVANINVHLDAPHGWTGTEVTLTEAVGDRLWAALQRARTEQALRESEERLRSFAETSSDVLWIADAETGQLEFLSPAYETIWGEPRDAVMADIGHWATRVHPDDRAAAAEAIGIARAGGRRMVEYRIIRPDGGVRYINDTGFPILADGKVRRIAGVAQDLTERHRAERALAETEQRLRTLMEGIPQLVWRGVDGGEWTWASPQWTDYTGQPEAESHGHGWLEPVHPEDRERVLAIWNGAVGRGEFHADYRIYHAPEARYRWFQTRATAVRDEQGGVIEWLGTSTDVDDLRALQDRQQVLMAELQHRVRNILTVTRSVFSRTVEAGGPVDEVADHFKGRLDSLARTQVIVTQSATGRVDLENLIRDELLSVGGADGPGLIIEGPDVQLEAGAAESIGLAIHELTTNALKYGALKYAGATISIRWEVNIDYRGRSRLDLKWLEQGVPAIPVRPIREGFGTELITEALPYRLGAETRLDLRGGGVSCSISVPLPDPGASVA